MEVLQDFVNFFPFIYQNFILKSEDKHGWEIKHDINKNNTDHV